MHIVIIAGGTGSRLWPLSREAYPKPFLKVDGDASLLQKTFLRGQSAGPVESVTTVTHRELFFRTDEEYRALSPRQPLHYLLEPFGRNTAPAICSAALELQYRYGDDARMLVLPADHLVQDEAAFRRAVDNAMEAAAQGRLVTFGIQPTRAETGFGYIEKGEPLPSTADTALEVVRFIEKPDRATAEHYLAGGRHLWNSGMFCFRVDSLLGELGTHAPALLQATQAALESARRSEGEAHSLAHLDAGYFDAVVGESIDRALMEKSSRVAVVPCEPGWRDIGSWQAMADLVEPDEQGNSVLGDAELEDTRNCYIHSRHGLTATLGVRDLVIVDTPDALLVAHKDRCQDVKTITERLEARDKGWQRHHGKVHRPWGTYTVLEEGNRFKIKRIEVKPGASLSLQMHYHRNEHWIVVSGTARVINENEDALLRTNESTYIPAGHRHRLENPGLVPLVMIEVQSGDYLGEDDILRFEDDYGRCGP
ncbi:mannose-1-phosphate guanylyltransferase/mannose-6-phosphate isomerase [Halomonas elongata]|uniref:mannose-1-phosphate guanylyltransferase/mannose-6-phosphate isomerase n=1 Tax=Halomonas elongata TaxID=2746 RepID=UPI0023B1F60F|nr:mannose-1-phosphate guanylyltransferase/mannose-6-phosphate isomerase [Halomonas elongata]